VGTSSGRPVEHGDAPAGPSTPGERRDAIEARAERYMLTHPGARLYELTNNLRLPAEQIRRIADRVDAVRRAWSAAGPLETRVAMTIEAPLTPRAKAFIDRSAGAMSAGNLAELMQWALPPVEAYLRSDEHRDAADASGSAEARGPAHADPAAQESTGGVREPGSRIDPRKRSRIVRMLTSNSTMSYREIATACSTRYEVVRSLAREHDLERSMRAPIGRARSDLIDDFMLFPRTSLAVLARQYRVPHAAVQELRAGFGRIRRDWDAVCGADIADARPELCDSLSDRARWFLHQWGGRMSAGSLALVMRRPVAAIDAYLHSNEYRQPTSGPAASPHADAQPRPPGLQSPLSDQQKAEIRKWGGEGMMVDSLSVYLGVPEPAIEAYMRSDDYLTRVRDLPHAYRPPAADNFPSAHR
jgi:hypothetical protein